MSRDRETREYRRELRRQARAERQTVESRLLRASRLRRIVYLGIPLAIIVAVLAYAIGSSLKATVDERVGQEMPLEAASHVPEGTSLQYKNSPPSSGTHYAATRPWRLYEEPVNPGNWIHNLEHGGIVILYNCPEECPDLVDQLRKAYNDFPPSSFGNIKLLITPYTAMDSKLAIVAWGWMDQMEEFDKDRLIKFYRGHVDRGPEAVAN